MERQFWTVSRIGWLIFVLLLLASSFLRGPSSDSLTAAPHTISTREHSYDADWPDVYLMVAQKCAACHAGRNDACVLTTYSQIADGKTMDGRRLVVPGKPEESALWQAVAWNVDALPDSKLPNQPMMPEDPAEWLTRGQLDTIYRWIQNGGLEYKLPGTCSSHVLTEMDFPSAKECKACHPTQYDQWSRSMHHYAQHSPMFEAFNLTLVERTGGTIGTFCSRCHTPIGTALGENASRRNIHRSRISMEGVTCVVCHRMNRPYYKSNARHAIEPGTLIDGCMYGPFDDPVDSKVTKSHRAEGKPFLKTSAFCGGCHDVTNPQGVRLEEAYSEWQNSPAAKQGITCQQCHMGPVQGVPIADCERPLGRIAVVPGVDPSLIPLRRLSDHTFSGPDYSMLPDTEFPEKLDWMYETDYRHTHGLTPHQQRTLRDLRRRNRKQLKIANEKRYELLHNAAEIKVCAPASSPAGRMTHVHVDVRSKFAGHSFPTGFSAERQAWVQITLRDPHGKVVFATGDLDHNGDLRDAHSHDVEAGKLAIDKQLFNLQNKFSALTQKGTDRTVVLPVNRHLAPLSFVRPAPGIPASFGRPFGFRLAKSSLPPLETMGRNYHIHVPNTPGQYLLDVRLNFRHLPPSLLDAIGAPQFKHLLEIVVIDQHQSVIYVTPN